MEIKPAGLRGFRAGADTTGNTPTRADCLYFSAVTITSMGTTDLRPNGVGRIIQVIEVSAGLLLFGLVVAKLSSARTAYFLRRLYSSDAQKRIVYFEEAIQRLTMEFGEISKALTNGHDVQINGELLAIWLDETMNVCIGARKYIQFESQHGTFFSDVPPRAVRKLARRLNVLTLMLAARWPQIVAADPPRIGGNFYRKRLRGTARNIVGLCDCIHRGSSNDETLRITEQTSRDARQLAESQEDPSTPPAIPATLGGPPEAED